MAYDLEEQDQLDALKTWWKTNGNKVTNVLIVVLLAYTGYQAWNFYQTKQILTASAKYEQLTQTQEKDIKAVKAISADLMENYASTPYAARAALLVAKANYNAKDVKSAKAQLDWATKNAKEDAIKALAQLQLAGMQYEEKQYDEALNTLSNEKIAGFEGLVADLTGDVLVAQGKTDEAKKAYTEALAHLEAKGRYAKYTQQKLEALGS